VCPFLCSLRGLASVVTEKFGKKFSMPLSSSPSRAWGRGQDVYQVAASLGWKGSMRWPVRPRLLRRHDMADPFQLLAPNKMLSCAVRSFVDVANEALPTAADGDAGASRETLPTKLLMPIGALAVGPFRPSILWATGAMLRLAELEYSPPPWEAAEGPEKELPE
jgi:hypothetical protein